MGVGVGSVADAVGLVGEVTMRMVEEEGAQQKMGTPAGWLCDGDCPLHTQVLPSCGPPSAGSCAAMCSM